MRIEGWQNNINIPLLDMQRSAVFAGFAAAGAQRQNTAGQQGTPGVILEISQEAKDYARKLEEIQKTEGCQTCKNRRYVDASSDSTVSYQSPTKIGPGEAAGKVMAHEQEHVTNETARAEQNDRKVVSSSVSLQTSICPECGRMYVSGGSARVLTASDNKQDAGDDSQSAESPKGFSSPNI